MVPRYVRVVKKLPYTIVFDKNGRKFASMSGVNLERFDRMIRRAAEIQ